MSLFFIWVLVFVERFVVWLCQKSDQSLSTWNFGCTQITRGKNGRLKERTKIKRTNDDIIITAQKTRHADDDHHHICIVRIIIFIAANEKPKINVRIFPVKCLLLRLIYHPFIAKILQNNYTKFYSRSQVIIIFKNQGLLFLTTST